MRSELCPFSCLKARPHRGRQLCRKPGRQLLPDEVLGTPEGVEIFAECGLATKLFGGNLNNGAQED